MPALPSPAHPLIGREQALDTLTTRSDGPSVTVIGGDAGVGKTRLITEVMARAGAAGKTVLAGHCLDLGESSAAYLPFSEMLRRLTQDDPEIGTQLREQWPLLAPLLRSGRAPVPSEEQIADLDPAAFFEAVHAYLEHLATRCRLYVVLEDAHWADRSTRDLLTYLFTIGFRGPVSLIVTYRSDDLFRKHPLRRKLAEWTRLPHVQRMSLDPLTDEEVTDLLRSRSPELTGPHLDRIVTRSAGNPFFAEELLAVADLDQIGLPDELADLLILRIEGLDDDARTVVRAASVTGQFITHDLLHHVAGLPDTSLERALRTLVEHHIFQTTPSGGYAFRHALLAEAVADDLLPGERIRLHQRYAEAWRERSEPGAAAALAFHARAAGMTQLALSASVEAGDEAMAASGPSDAAQHYENAIALSVETPHSVNGTGHADLALRAGAALMTAGDPHRAMDVLRAAHQDDSTSDDDRARLAVRLMEAELIVDPPTLSISLLDDAIATLEDRPPTKTLAQLHAVRARVLLSERALDDSALAATEALRLARELELPMTVTNATTTLARLDDFAGDIDASRARLADVVDEARRSADVAAEVRALHQLAIVMARADQPDEAARILAEAVDRAVEQDFPTGPFALEARPLSAYYSILTGEWDRADRLLQTGSLRIPEIALAMMQATHVVLMHRRGDTEQALDTATGLRPMWGRDMYVAIHSASVCVRVPGEHGDVGTALGTYDDLVEEMRTAFGLKAFDAQIRFAAELTGYIASELVARRIKGSDYEDRVQALTDDAERVVDLRWSSESLGAESRAWLSLLHAERARFEWHGAGAPPDEAIAHAEHAVTTFDSLGYRYDAAHARGRLAELLMTSGRTQQAREVAATALRDARSLGARALATRLGSPTGRAAKPGRLTPRERDVLALVAAGHTNGEIASRLFITTKTASVHVSHILAKLGASTRTEAAALVAKDPSLLDR